MGDTGIALCPKLCSDAVLEKLERGCSKTERVEQENDAQIKEGVRQIFCPPGKFMSPSSKYQRKSVHVTPPKSSIEILFHTFLVFNGIIHLAHP